MTEFHSVVTYDAHSINRWSCEVCFKNEQDAQNWWKFNTNKKLQLHHILKWCEKHETNISNTSILCEECHKNLHKYEKIDKKRYQEINNYLSQYKDSY